MSDKSWRPAPAKERDWEWVAANAADDWGLIRRVWASRSDESTEETDSSVSESECSDELSVDGESEDAASEDEEEAEEETCFCCFFLLVVPSSSEIEIRGGSLYSSTSESWRFFCFCSSQLVSYDT